MSNEPLADPTRFKLVQVWKDQSHGLTQSWPLHPTPPSVLIKLIYGGNKRPPTQHASLAPMLLQLLAFQTARTSQPVSPKSSYEILALLQCRQQYFPTHHSWHIPCLTYDQSMQIHASCSKLQESYCKFMSADFTKGTVSCYQELVTEFDTNFKDQQTVKNRTIKGLKAEQSPDFQQRGHKQSQ